MSKDDNKKALFRFLRTRKAIPVPINIDSIVPSPKQLLESLDKFAKGLEQRFITQLQVNFVGALSEGDFTEVTMEELEHVVRLLPGTAPWPDGITSGMLKILFDLSPQDLANIVNYSLGNAWILPDWKLAKIIPLLKKQGAGMHIDNIRPIALTSNVMKLIERVLHILIMKFVTDN